MLDSAISSALRTTHLDARFTNLQRIHGKIQGPFTVKQGFISPARSGARVDSCLNSTSTSQISCTFQTPNSRKLFQQGSIYQRPATTSRRVLQSDVVLWRVAIFSGLIGGLVTYTIHRKSARESRREQRRPDRSEKFQDELTIIRKENRGNMTGEALPGRPGTLTAVQEEKLKELWTATLTVCGVIDVEQAKEVNLNGSVDGSHRKNPDTSSLKKQKKKRFFSRKRNDEDTESIPAVSKAHSPVAVVDSEDKYGQSKDFQEALSNMSPETIRTTFWSMVKHDHPDALLLRFLRARKWDVEKALVMMISTMRWRAVEMHVDDDIMKNGEGGALEASKSTDSAKKKHAEDFLTQMRMGKSFLHGLDKAGRPMCFVRVRLHKQGEQSEESLERYTVYLIESARMVLSPPIDTACLFFDMTGFSLANMDYAPVKFMIKCFEANYPESLGVVLVHKAPWVFQGIWKIIKGWLDPVVASKVNFTNNVEEVEDYVARSHIIKELGGDEDWSYEYIEPVNGENDRMKEIETRDNLLAERAKLFKDYENVTLDWIHGRGSDPTDVKTRRNELANAMREDYWRIDPYLRARSHYDRVDMICPGGKIQFYPEKPATNGHNLVEAPTDDID